MLEAIITSTLLIIIVLILRAALGKKMKPTVRYALWLVVALRLILPFSLIKSPVSVMNLFSGKSIESRSYRELPASQHKSEQALCYVWRRRQVWIEKPICICEKADDKTYSVAYLMRDGEFYTLEGFLMVICDDGVWRAKNRIEIK